MGTSLFGVISFLLHPIAFVREAWQARDEFGPAKRPHRKQLTERIDATLRGAGLTDQPREFDSNIHSWRCEHPDRYGPCSCFQELVDDLLRAVDPDQAKES